MKYIITWLIVTIGCYMLRSFAAESGPLIDMEIAESLRRDNTISHHDSVFLSRYVGDLRMWLIDAGFASEEAAGAVAKRMLGDRDAREVIKMAKLARQIERNQRLSRRLEMQSMWASQAIEAILGRKDPEGMVGEVMQLEKMVMVSWEARKQTLRELDLPRETLGAGEAMVEGESDGRQ